MITLSDLRTKLKIYAQNENIDTTLANNLINDAYLELYGKVKNTDLINEYWVDSIYNTAYDNYWTYVTINKTWIIWYKVIWNNTKLKMIQTTTYKVYLQVWNTEVILRIFTNVSKLSWDSSATIFSNEAIDNLLVYFATVKYFDYINQDQKAAIWSQKLDMAIKELTWIGEDQDFISADSTDNATNIFNLW